MTASALRLQPELVGHVLVAGSAAAKGKIVGASKKVQTATDETRAQLQSLRDQVEQLLNDHVTPAITDAAGRAETAVHTARDYTNAKADTVSKRVRGQPLVAIAVSAAVGYLLGRIAR